VAVVNYFSDKAASDTDDQEVVTQQQVDWLHPHHHKGLHTTA
jgi:hypothetical protein